MVGSRSASPMDFSISSGIGGTMVLSCSGRFSVMVATGPSVLYSSVSNSGVVVGIAAVESLRFRKSRCRLSRRPYRKLLSMLRVIQWATGSVGRHAVAAIHDHPGLGLVGALVYSDAKAGRDVGDICGIGPIGVTATTDPAEIVALDADCVLYMPQGEMNPMGGLDDICRLLASGKNVVSTAVTGLIYPPSPGRRGVERLGPPAPHGRTASH